MARTIGIKKNKKTALIAGITGQDGIYLSRLLIKNNFQVIGLSRKKSTNKKNLLIIKTNYSGKSIRKIIKKYKPVQIYNLASISSPSLSWLRPTDSFKSIIDITTTFLEILKKNNSIKFFNASTSEIFKDSKKKLNENSPIFPANPYGIAKAAAHFMVSAYRKKYKIFAVNGIFFNHASPYTKKKFLPSYLISECAKVKKNPNYIINIQDSRPVRDFGFAADYMEASYKILSQQKPEDFIIATGKSMSVKNLVNIVCRRMEISSKNIKYNNKKKINVNLFIKASIKKINRISWQPKTSAENLIKTMIESKVK
jgi:GDPmannose 4,6-dehydratase